MYTVKHAAALTGIPVDTLRVWERRYGVVRPARSAGGYRLYDDAAITRLTAMRALVEAGWTPSRAAVQVSSGTTVGPHASPEPPSDDTSPPLEQREDADLLLRVASAFDTRALAPVLEQKFLEEALEELADSWLMPALSMLGEGWRRGEVSVAAEHYVSAAVQRRLAAALDAVPPAASGRRVLVGLARGSRHELGVLTFAVLLARAGLDVAYLGPDVPPDSWVVAVESSAAGAVVLGVPRLEDVASARDVVAAVGAARPDLPILLGGGHQHDVGAGEPMGHALAAAARSVAARVATEASGARSR